MWVFFLLICLVSAVGSLQPGLVNVAVVQTGLRQGLAASLWLALGGSLPELLYAGLAWQIHRGVHGWLANWSHLAPALPWLAAAALVLGGLYYLHQARLPVQAQAQSRVRSHRKALAEGFILALQNAQLVVFWLFVLTYLPQWPWALAPSHQSSQWLPLVLMLGSGLGAFAFLAGLAWLTARWGQRLGASFAPRASFWSGIILLAVAALTIWQALK
ncbi:MAG: LysE family transporter [Bernardetiaceae bacterium]|jgi:threonine/homoserine/homoserine lactone efflux protein|nr:LysE family transporter [Bernardetiaceae bacterium]